MQTTLLIYCSPVLLTLALASIVAVWEEVRLFFVQAPLAARHPEVK